MRKNIVRSDCVFSNLVGFFSGEALISLEPNLIFNGQDYKILKAIFETNEIQNFFIQQILYDSYVAFEEKSYYYIYKMPK